MHLAFPRIHLIYLHSAFPLPLFCGSSALHRMQQTVLDAESPLKMHRTFSLIFQFRKCSTGYNVHRTKQCYKGTTCAPADIRNGGQLISRGAASGDQPKLFSISMAPQHGMMLLAQRQCIWALMQGHCNANHLRKRVLTYAI